MDFLSILHNIEVRSEALISLKNDNKIAYKDSYTIHRRIKLRILHSTGDYEFDIYFEALPCDKFIKY